MAERIEITKYKAEYLRGMLAGMLCAGEQVDWGTFWEAINNFKIKYEQMIDEHSAQKARGPE